MSAHFLRDCVRSPAAAWQLQNVTTATIVASRVAAAFDRDSRNQGLLGRDGLAAAEALVLAPCSAVHTWFMRFPIDILFVSRSGEVLKVRRAVRPWRLAVRLGAFAVIETAAGAAAGTDCGHRLAVVPARPVA